MAATSVAAALVLTAAGGIAYLITSVMSARDDASAELWFGGDVHLGDHAAALGPVRAAVEGAHGIVNLEGPTGEGAAASTEERLVNSAPRLAGLASAGIRVVGIANNHAQDLGTDGPAHTADAARKAGLLPSGGPAGAAVLDAHGVRIVVTAHDLRDGVPAHLAADLDAARLAGDALVATFHVTGPPSYLPRKELRDAVAIALTAGARVVTAHGTHTIGPVERRGDAVIAWGLGNLLFACACSRETDGAVLRVSIPRRGPIRATIIPVRAGLGGAPAQIEPDAKLAFDLFDALGSTPLRRDHDRASF